MTAWLTSEGASSQVSSAFANFSGIKIAKNGSVRISYKTIFVSLLFLFGSLPSTPSYAAVWPTEHSWDESIRPSWEDRYSQWIETLQTKEFRDANGYGLADIFLSQGLVINGQLVKRNPYYGIATDCAHAVYIVRAIFAYENHLPFVIHTANSSMTKWDDLPLSPDQRFRKFAEYLTTVTSTNTLPRDTYSVAIDRQHVRPGTTFVEMSRTDDGRCVGAHGAFVSQVYDTGVIETLSSDVPKAVRKLILIEFEGEISQCDKQDGFRAWRHPQDLFKPQEQITDYSEAQYELQTRNHFRDKANDWNMAIPYQQAVFELLRKPGTAPENPFQTVQREMKYACGYAQVRVNIVYDAVKEMADLHGRGIRCMPKGGFEDSYSTPERDSLLAMFLQRLISAINVYTAGESLRMKNRISDSLIKDPQYCAIHYDPTNSRKIVTLDDLAVGLATRVPSKMVSSNPNENLEARWGQGQPDGVCPFP